MEHTGQRRLLPRGVAVTSRRVELSAVAHGGVDAQVEQPGRFPVVAWHADYCCIVAARALAAGRTAKTRARINRDLQGVLL